MKKNITLKSLGCALGTFGYVALVGFLMMNGDELFGKQESIVAIIAFLLLFVMSACITGILILGGPIWNYMEGNKKTAVKWLFYNLGWLVIITLTSLLILTM